MSFHFVPTSKILVTMETNIKKNNLKSDNGGISDNGGVGRGHKLLGNSLVIFTI